MNLLPNILKQWFSTSGSQFLHRGHLRLSENTDIYIMIHNIAKLQLLSPSSQHQD